MTTIPTGDMVYDPASYVDPVGRVFRWNGRVVRGITREYADHFTRLLRNPAIAQMQANGTLVESWILPDQSDVFPLLIEHREIRYPSYCVEWTPEMLKDAALLTLSLCMNALDHGLILQDAYPWNVFFDGSKPVFIDVGSIVPMQQDVLWAAYEQFCQFFLYPLHLYSLGYYEIVRPMLFDYLGGVSAANFAKLADTRFKMRHPLRYAEASASGRVAAMSERAERGQWLKRMFAQASRHLDVPRARARFIDGLMREVESIKVPAADSHWRRYYGPECSYDESAFSRKQKVVTSVLHQVRPESVLDLGCNTGAFAAAAADVCRVVACDRDEPSVSRLYSRAKQDARVVLPLVMDAVNPTPAFGWCGRQFPAAVERLRTEMVFAFALVHHLAISQRQSFARICDTLDAFATRSVLLEFVAPGDPKARVLLANSLYSYEWYSVETLSAELHRRYRRVTFFDPHAPHRQMILCERS
jgi:SAM-dependent methyltransferase